MLIATIVMLIVSLVVALSQKPKAQPTPDQEMSMNTASAGRVIPDVIGTVTLKGTNTVWYGDLGTEPVKSKGGK